MTKYIYLIIAHFVFNISFSQVNTCGQIEYTLTKNIAYEYTEYYKMIFNDSISYSEEIEISKVKSKLVKDVDDEMLTNKIISGRKNETPAFYYKNKNEFYFSEIWDDEVLIVKENKFNWDWKLHTETKKIGDFTSQKATIKFRGRNYTAWFTNDIPVRYGPWKFQGLSGLILEVYDDDYFLHITTTSINIRDSNNCTVKFNQKKLENSISVKEYLKKQIELTKAKFAKISSKLPQGSKPLILDENCEGCNSSKIEIFENEE